MLQVHYPCSIQPQRNLASEYVKVLKSSRLREQEATRPLSFIHSTAAGHMISFVRTISTASRRPFKLTLSSTLCPPLLSNSQSSMSEQSKSTSTSRSKEAYQERITKIYEPHSHGYATQPHETPLRPARSMALTSPSARVLPRSACLPVTSRSQKPILRMYRSSTSSPRYLHMSALWWTKVSVDVQQALIVGQESEYAVIINCLMQNGATQVTSQGK